MKKRLAGLLLLVILMGVMLSGCGSRDESAMWDKNDTATETTTSEDKKMDFAEEQGEAEMAVEFDEAKEMERPSSDGSFANGMNQSATEALANRKIIKTANIYMETLEFDKTVEEIRVLMNMYGGYTSHSQIEGGNRNKEYSSRFASYTIKVPAENFEMLFYDVQEIGNVLNASDSIQDVTSQVTDIEARLKTLEIQEERLLDILSRLENLEDIVELEYALQEVRYEIETYTASLRNIEDRVRFSTIVLRVQEVFEETVIIEKPPTFGERIEMGLDDTFTEIREGFENFIIYVATKFPYILFNILVIVVVFFIGRRIYRKNLASFKASRSDDTNNE